jgi:hypothetical protein
LNINEFSEHCNEEAAYERGTEGYMEMEKKKCPGNVGNFILVGWEKSKQNRFRKR